MEIVFHPAAREEAYEGYLYYGAADDELGLDFERKINITFDRAACSERLPQPAAS